MLTENPTNAYIYSVMQIFATGATLLFFQKMLGRMNRVKPTVRMVMFGVLGYGIIGFFFVIFRMNIIRGDRGYEFDFASPTAYWCFNIFVLLAILDIFFLSMHMMRKARNQKYRVFSRLFYLADFLLALGFAVDIVIKFEKIHLYNYAASTMMQFVAILIMTKAIRDLSRCEINVSNMSSFIISSMSSPVLVFDMDRELKLANGAATEVLHFS
ncbi:MAG: hypothetical protein K6G62_02000, partial [Eubacterium sp.]|nr:hypothetical protein [Eubacterium sp.]